MRRWAARRWAVAVRLRVPQSRQQPPPQPPPRHHTQSGWRRRGSRRVRWRRRRRRGRAAAVAAVGAQVAARVAAPTVAAARRPLPQSRSQTGRYKPCCTRRTCFWRDCPVSSPRSPPRAPPTQHAAAAVLATAAEAVGVAQAAEAVRAAAAAEAVGAAEAAEAAAVAVDAAATTVAAGVAGRGRLPAALTPHGLSRRLAPRRLRLRRPHHMPPLPPPPPLQGWLPRGLVRAAKGAAARARQGVTAPSSWARASQPSQRHILP